MLPIALPEMLCIKVGASHQMMVVYRFTLMLILVILGSDCVPVTTPPQLTFTPGSPVIIADQQIFFSGLQVIYPSGWRVITSESAASPSLLLVEPDQTGLILIAPGNQVEPPAFDAIPADQRQTVQRQIQMNQSVVTLWLVTDQSHLGQLTSVLQQIADSIKPQS